MLERLGGSLWFPEALVAAPRGSEGGNTDASFRRISSYNKQTCLHHGVKRKWHECCVGSASHPVAVAITPFGIIVL